jgi:hypothetical protein
LHGAACTPQAADKFNAWQPVLGDAPTCSYSDPSNVVA